MLQAHRESMSRDGKLNRFLPFSLAIENGSVELRKKWQWTYNEIKAGFYLGAFCWVIPLLQVTILSPDLTQVLSCLPHKRNAKLLASSTKLRQRRGKEYQFLYMNVMQRLKMYETKQKWNFVLVNEAFYDFASFGCWDSYLAKNCLTRPSPSRTHSSRLAVA